MDGWMDQSLHLLAAMRLNGWDPGGSPTSIIAWLESQLNYAA